MNVTELYYEKLVTTGNYSNVRFGARIDTADRDVSIARRELQEYVDVELARLIADKTAQNVESSLRCIVDGLKNQESELRQKLEALVAWRQDNIELVRLYELTLGKNFDPVPF